MSNIDARRGEIMTRARTMKLEAGSSPPVVARQNIMENRREDEIGLQLPPGSWCWLLAPDGSPAMAAVHSTELYSIDARRGEKIPTVAPAVTLEADDLSCHLPPPAAPRKEDTGNGREGLLSPDGSPVMAAVHPTEPKRKGRDQTHHQNTTDSATLTPPVPVAKTETESLGNYSDLKPGSWFWHLKPDGSPAMGNTTTTTDSVGEDRKTAASSPVTICVDQTAEDSKSKMKLGSWYWLRAPDGSLAMGTTTTTTNSVDEERKPAASSPVSIRKDQIAEDSKSKMKSSSWYWLRAPDGSHATQKEPGTAGKRKRDRHNDVGSSRQSRRRASTKAQIVDNTESDEENSLLENNDEYAVACNDDNNKNNESRNNISDGRYRFEHARWEVNYQSLVEYKKKHGTTKVLGKTTSLGMWVGTQRRAYRNKKLPRYRYQCLHSIGFEFTVLVPWTEMYKQLRSYKRQHNGSTRVTEYSVKYKKLGKWVQRQRQNYFKDKLPQDRIDLLESIGFEWKILHHHDWMEMFKRLVAYKKEHNTTRIPRFSKEYHQLALWVQTQRDNCKEKDRIDLLNGTGFEWNPCRVDWMKMYQRLVVYKQKYGTTTVPYGWKDDPQLAVWVAKQRQHCKESYRIDLLNDIGFAFDRFGEHWMEMYQRLVAYKMKYGTLNVSVEWKDDPRLARWVHLQRKSCKERYRIELLNDIGFVWNPLRDEWMKMYQRLVAYKQKYGSTCIPKMWRNDPQLGSWVSKQHTRCKDKGRIYLLNDIGFVWSASV